MHGFGSNLLPVLSPAAIPAKACAHAEDIMSGGADRSAIASFVLNVMGLLTSDTLALRTPQGDWAMKWGATLLYALEMDPT
jgi:hypothetical protein